MSKQSPAPKSRSGASPAKTGIAATLIAALVWLTGGCSWANLLDWMKSITIAVGLALLIRWPVGEPFRIPSGSMEPTLHGDERFLRGDRVWVNKYVYGVRYPLNHVRIPVIDKMLHYATDRIYHGAEPQRWDIVVFKSIEDDPRHNTLIKRVVGLPGERIHIADGKIHINGKPLELPPGMPDVYYTTPVGMTYGILEDDAHSLIPEGHYLLLGDNSSSSRDGRVWGWVPNERIVGRAACIWWPPTRCRDFTGFTKTLWWRTLMTVLGIMLFVRLFIGRSWRVLRPGSSAEGDRPQIDHLYISRWPFGIPIPFSSARFNRGRVPRRNELVLFAASPAPNQPQQFFTGRVTALPGERMTIAGDEIQVAPPEPAGAPRAKGGKAQAVPESHYFIVADPAVEANASDSRTLGPIHRNDLVGIVTARWWPIKRWARLR